MSNFEVLGCCGISDSGTVQITQTSGYATVVSARSGDPEDSRSADFVVARSAIEIEVGSTMRSE